MTQNVVNKQTEASMLIRYYCSEKKKKKNNNSLKKTLQKHRVSENVIITIDSLSIYTAMQITPLLAKRKLIASARR